MSGNPYSVVCKPKAGIGLVGFGTVGQGVWKHLEAQRTALGARLGMEVRTVRIAVRDLKRERDFHPPAGILTDDPFAVVHDPEVDIVCELMGGTGLALEVTLRALRAGKIVVSANKALIADHGEAIFRAEREHGGRFFFEASVAGGIPIVKAIRESLVANRFDLICGIVNGTTNYILSGMERDGLPYESVLEGARALGYVEADESLDLDGIDAFHKAVVLAYLAHGKWVTRGEASVDGIRRITLGDIRSARESGFRIKLMAVIRRNFAANTMTMGVHPVLIPLDAVLAKVDGGFNGITLRGDIVGSQTFVGRGAGRDATSSAVLGDIVDALVALRDGGSRADTASDTGIRMAGPEEIEGKFYVRIVPDSPDTDLVRRVFAEGNVPMSRFHLEEDEADGVRTITLFTGKTDEAAMARVMARLGESPAVSRPPLMLRVFDPGN